MVVNHSRKAKSRILSLENLRGIVRQAKVRKSANSVVTDLSGYVTKADSSSKIFQPTSLSFFFFTMTANDRGYGLGRAAGEFPVAIATKEMRAQRLPEAH